MPESFTLDDIIDYSLSKHILSTTNDPHLELTNRQFHALNDMVNHPATITEEAILPRTFNIVLP